ncbi:hypothetical protein CRYUN_Cryun37aG0025300 [Craigia yunnanensis]
MFWPVLGTEFSFQEMPIGGAALDLTGVPLPGETLSAAQKADAVLLGAIGGYKWDKNEKHLKPETGPLQLGEGLKVFANLRPATVLPQLVDSSTLKKDVAEGVDLMVVRELIGAFILYWNYVFILENRGDLVPMKRVKILASTLRCMLLMRLIVLLVLHLRLLGSGADNSVLLTKLMFWRHQCYGGKELRQLLPNILTLSSHTCMLTMQLVRYPKQGPGLFEPIHSSAPDIAGQDKANPLATILSAAMLLKYGLGEANAVKRIENAVLDTLNRGFRMGDIYSAGNKLVGCKEMGEEVLKSADSVLAAI